MVFVGAIGTSSPFPLSRDPPYVTVRRHREKRVDSSTPRPPTS